MADDDLLPAVLKKENKNGAPIAATLLVAVLCAALSCFPSATEILVNLGSFVAAVNISIVIISAVFARKKVPYVEGNFRAPGGNIVSIITVIVIVATYIPKIISGNNSSMWIFSAVIYAVGLVVMNYYLKKKANN